MTDRAASASPGFTLLELLVVLALLAVAATLIIPSISSNDSKIFRAQVSQAVSVLNYARRIAIVKALPGVAIFSSAAAAAEPAANTRPDEKAKPNSVRWHSAELSLAFQAERDQRPEAVDQVELVFFPEGGSTGGILTFQWEQLRAEIRVDPITGRISLHYPDDETEN
ncbi:MAG: prepilin-type N-terminal cleavage/methylation domain-containing protein [Pseudomonadales bacterium]|nr:prepilin-type N-terminal cleavage/methylation domain-containing protein [Pseudomonadales bacterium]